jgi:hypothetical protein
LKALSEFIGITQADGLRWALCFAGKEAAEQGIVGPGLEDDIERKLDEINHRVSTLAATQKSTGEGLINQALRGEYGEEASNELREKHCEVLREVAEQNQNIRNLLPEPEHRDDEDGFLDEL